MHQARKVLFVTAEAFPLVKTGGLGDVAGSLPAALQQFGVDVRVVMPAYADVLKDLHGIMTGPTLGEVLPGVHARLLEARLPGTAVPLTLIDCPELYARSGSPYQQPDGNDWPDNHLRFGLLSRAAALLGTAGSLAGWQPDLLHANDWHGGLVPLYVRMGRPTQHSPPPTPGATRASHSRPNGAPATSSPAPRTAKKPPHHPYSPNSHSPSSNRLIPPPERGRSGGGRFLLHAGRTTPP